MPPLRSGELGAMRSLIMGEAEVAEGEDTGQKDKAEVSGKEVEAANLKRAV